MEEDNEREIGSWMMIVMMVIMLLLMIVTIVIMRISVMMVMMTNNSDDNGDNNSSDYARYLIVTCSNHLLIINYCSNRFVDTMMINHQITSSPSMKDMMVNEAHDDDNTL